MVPRWQRDWDFSVFISTNLAFISEMEGAAKTFRAHGSGSFVGD
jgi:hypothetical protein